MLKKSNVFVAGIQISGHKTARKEILGLKMINDK